MRCATARSVVTSASPRHRYLLLQPIDAVVARKLVLYSDPECENNALDQRMLALIGVPQPRIGYLPSASEPRRVWFERTSARYASLGATLGPYFGLEADYQPHHLPDLLACDALHLAGGNTFHFLWCLQQRDMLPVLRDYVARGGVLIGISAGAVLMGPQIDLASVCGDERVAGLQDTAGLNLVDFDFVPHQEGSASSIDALAAYLATTGRRLYACVDGAGLVVDGETVTAFGQVKAIPAD